MLYLARLALLEGEGARLVGEHKKSTEMWEETGPGLSSVQHPQQHFAEEIFDFLPSKTKVKPFGCLLSKRIPEKTTFLIKPTPSLSKTNKASSHTPQLSLFNVNPRMEQLPHSGDNLLDVLTHHPHSEHCSSLGSKQISALNNPLHAVILAGTKPWVSFMKRNV